MIDLQKLRTLAEAAVAGPWVADTRLGTVETAPGPVWQWIARDMTIPNAEYVAAADPQTVLALLDVIADLSDQIAEAGR